MDALKGIHIKQIIKNTSAQFVVKLITSTTTLLVLLVITYLQGFDLLGQVTKITAFVTFFYLAADFGLNQIFIRDYYEKVTDEIGNLLLTRTFFSAILIIIAVGIALLLPFDPSNQTGFSSVEKAGIVLFSLTIFTYSLQLSLMSLLQRHLQYKYAIAPTFFGGLAIVGAASLGTSYDSLFIILTGYIIGQLITSFTLYHKLREVYSLKLNFFHWRTFLSRISLAATPLAIVLLLNLIHSKADVFILSIMKPNFEVGIYGFSYRIFEMLIIIPTFLSNSIYPILIKKERSSEFITLIKRYSVILLGLAIIASSAVFLFAPLLKILRGDISLSVPPLQILSLSLPFFFLTSIMQWVLIIKKRLIVLASIYATTMTINIILNIAYVPEFTYFATAATTVISEGLVFVLMIIYFMLEKAKIFQNNK